MLRPALAAALLLTAPVTFAQAVTRPTVTASAGIMRTVAEVVSTSPSGGRVEYDGRTFYAATIGGEAPVYGVSPLVTASVGARVRAVSAAFDGGLAPQSATVYARLGTAAASGLLGVALDIGSGLFESGNTSPINSDGQTAIIAQLSGGIPAGPARLFAQLDGAFALPTSGELPITTPDPDSPDGGVYQYRVNTGNQGSIRLGASVPAGPVEVALALVVAGRTEGSYRFTDVVLPDGGTNPGGIEIGQEFPVQLGYSRTVGLIPSLTYRAPGGRLMLRAEGSFTGYFQLEDMPLGVTLSSAGGPEVRPAVTVSASLGF